MKNILRITFIVFTIILNMNTATAENTVLHETFQVEPDFELMIGHEFYKGVKIKGVKVKLVEISKDTNIKSGKIISEEPTSFSVVIELTDMKGRKIELYGARPLGDGDYQYIINDGKN